MNEFAANYFIFFTAIRDYQAAIEINDSLQRAKEGLQKAQKLQAQAERRDYYKILNVKRTATKKEITKAYRKAAQKWHPDNFGLKSDEEKKLAEKKFIDIAAAKEVSFKLDSRFFVVVKPYTKIV